VLWRFWKQNVIRYRAARSCALSIVLVVPNRNIMIHLHLWKIGYSSTSWTMTMMRQRHENRTRKHTKVQSRSLSSRTGDPEGSMHLSTSFESYRWSDMSPPFFFQMSSIHDWIAYVWPHFLLRLCVVFFLDWWIWSTLCVVCLLSWLKRIDVSFFLLSFLFVWESCVFHFYDNFLHRSIVCFVRWLRRFADNSRCTVSTVRPASRVACGFNLLEIHGKK
jgi:hypothetical protein